MDETELKQWTSAPHPTGTLRSGAETADPTGTLRSDGFQSPRLVTAGLNGLPIDASPWA